MLVKCEIIINKNHNNSINENMKSHISVNEIIFNFIDLPNSINSINEKIFLFDLSWISSFLISTKDYSKLFIIWI